MKTELELFFQFVFILPMDSPTILIPHHALQKYFENIVSTLNQFLLSAPKFSQTYPKNSKA